jgi:hypothetical protein
MTEAAFFCVLDVADRALRLGEYQRPKSILHLLALDQSLLDCSESALEESRSTDCSDVMHNCDDA